VVFGQICSWFERLFKSGILFYHLHKAM